MHYGIEKQCQRAFHTVIALRRAQLNEPGRGINYLAPEVIRRLYLLDHFSFADNRQISGVQLEIPLIETVTARPTQAEQMCQIFLPGIRTHNAQFVGDDDIFLVFHVVTV